MFVVEVHLLYFLMSSHSIAYQPQTDEILSTSHKVDEDKIHRFVTKFANNLKQHSPTYRFKTFSKRIHCIVADKAADFGYYLNNNLLNIQPTKAQRLKYHISKSTNLISLILYRIIEGFKKKELVLNPGGSFLCYWESFVLLLSILNIMYIPMSVCFNTDKADLWITKIFLGILPSYVFLLDMLLSFFKAYYEKGVMHDTKSEMFWHYVRGDFLFDFCVVFPFFLEACGVRNTNYFMLLRVTRIKRTFDTIEETFNFQEKSAALFELVYLVCFVVMASHFCACMFHYLAILEKEWGYDTTWQDAQHIADADWKTKYIYSLYFTAITSMTVGYGDIVPVTNPEKIFVTIITYLVTGVFGYVITTIGSVIYRLRELENQYQQRIRIINKIINARGLPNELQFKVRTYFEYYLHIQQEQQVNFEELMLQMNRNLREEVQIQLYYQLLSKSNFLRTNFSQEFIKSLCFKMKEQTYSPEEDVFTKGKMHNRLIIILSGTVQSYVPGRSLSDDILLRSYDEGLMIGEREFFLKETVQFYVKAKSFVQTASITEEDFNEMLGQYPRDLEKFCYLRDQYTFGEYVQDYGIACEVCSSSHGQNERCPFAFAHMNKGKIINVVTQSIDHKRTKARRRKAPQQKHDQFQIKQAAIRHMLKDAMTHKSYAEHPFNRQYLGLIGFTLDQVKFLKKSLLTSDLKNFMKQNNKKKRDPYEVQQEVEEILMLSQDVGDGGNMLVNFKSYNSVPMELKVSFDIDRMDVMKRDIYYPDDNVDRIIERMKVRSMMQKFTHIFKTTVGTNHIAQRLLTVFVSKKS